MNDTIAAISTPLGQGAIGIVRMSGKHAFGIISKIFKSTRKIPFPYRSNRIHHGLIIDPVTHKQIDEVLVSFMGTPLSYTTEDVVEINTHSNIIVMEKILSLLIEQGARLANPGEFTLRAFLGGRIDLTQAEAVADVIRAKSGKAIEIGQQQLLGGLGRRVQALYDTIIDCLKRLEIAIDFPESSGTGLKADVLETIIKGVIGPIDQLLNEYRDGLVYKEGIQIAIVGKTNVGKSSLLNRLTKDETVIVSEIPGTTRDSIACDISINGIPIQITDTAGIRNTLDPIESIGVEKAKKALDRAQVVLVMTDVYEPKIPQDVSTLLEKEKVVLWVINKIDLLGEGQKSGIEKFQNEAHLISAKHNQGINTLKEKIVHIIFKNSLEDHAVTNAPNRRHKQCLDAARLALVCATQKMKKEISEELIAIDIKDAATELQEILGTSADLDVIARIFEDFCVGK